MRDRFEAHCRGLVHRASCRERKGRGKTTDAHESRSRLQQQHQTCKERHDLRCFGQRHAGSQAPSQLGELDLQGRA